MLEDHFRVPELLDQALEVDYNTDDDDDGDAKGFSLKVPALADLLNDFEKDDDVLKQAAEISKTYKAEMKVKGFEVETRYDIKDLKREKINHLDANISSQRAEWGSRVPGMIEDINENIKDPRNKIYLR